MSERKSGAQDPHVGPDCMLLYQQEGDEQHRKAAERIRWLEQEVERLRVALDDTTGLMLDEQEWQQFFLRFGEKRLNAEARFNRLLERLEHLPCYDVVLDPDGFYVAEENDHGEFMKAEHVLQEAIAEARGDADA